MSSGNRNKSSVLIFKYHTYPTYALKFKILSIQMIYGSLPKNANTLNIRTPKIIAKNNFTYF